MNLVHTGQVTEVHIKDHEYGFLEVQDGKNTQKETLGPIADQALIDDLEKKDPAAGRTPNEKLQVYFEKEDSTPFWSSTLVTLLPMLFIGIMFFLFMRQLQAGGGRAMSLIQSHYLSPPIQCACFAQPRLRITNRPHR